MAALILILSVSCAAFFCTSCKKQTPLRTPEEILLEYEQTADLIVENSLDSAGVPFENQDFSIPKWMPSENDPIILLFGHGYSKWEGEEQQKAREELMNTLRKEVGLYSEGGIIEEMDFLQEYLTGKRIRTNFLATDLKGTNAQALIIVSAPDRTHYALAALQEVSGLPVYSVFPQDDVPGTEAGSAFVLDYQGDKAAQNDEEMASFDGDLSKVLIPMIKAIKKENKTDFVSEFRTKLADFYSSFSLTPYLDPETGLKSQNHFVLSVENAG